MVLSDTSVFIDRISSIVAQKVRSGPLEDLVEAAPPENIENEIPVQLEAESEKEIFIRDGIGATLLFLKQQGLLREATQEEIAKHGHRRSRWLYTKAPAQKKKEKSSDSLMPASFSIYKDQLEKIKSYQPVVSDLEYYDDQGKPLSSKEAYKELSHKFHGNAPSKKKKEKQAKKAQSVQEQQPVTGSANLMTTEKSPVQAKDTMPPQKRAKAPPQTKIFGLQRKYAH